MSEIKVTRYGGTICCVPLCSNNTKYSRDVSWHRFPKDINLRREWTRRVRRKGSTGKFSEWIPTSSHRICGIHFNKYGKKKYEDKLPCFFPNKVYANKHLNSDEGLVRHRPVKVETHNRIIYPVQFNEDSPSFWSQPINDIVDGIDSILSYNVSDFDIGANVTVQHVGLSSKIIIQPAEELRVKTASNESQTRDTHFHSYCLVGDNLLTAMYKMKINLEEVISSHDTLASENKMLKKEIDVLKKQLFIAQKKCSIAEAKLKIEQSKPAPSANKFSLKTIINDDKKIRFYTGFENKIRLKIFLDFIVEVYNTFNSKNNAGFGRPKALSIEDEIFIVLCRLRLGLLEADLACRFEVSVSTVNKIWQFWVNFISSSLSQIPIWPSRETVDRFMPTEFQERYPTTRIILDCTELFIENPTEFRVQSDTYSSYKSHNTAKGLIGITPNGFVSLVSDLVPGRVSDKVITNSSGLYTKLEPGDSVMADRGFLIEDSLNEIGVSLNIPPFLKGREQLSLEDEEITRDIAKLRIHVERVIRGVKQFRILKYVFPNSMADKLDPIWKICCILINFINEPLLHRNQSVEDEDL